MSPAMVSLEEALVKPTDPFAAASSSDHTMLSHTWEEKGALGLKIKHRGSDKNAPDGALVSKIDDPSLPVGEGMVLMTINGARCDNLSIDGIRSAIKAAGRPLTIEFAPSVALPSPATASSGRTASCVL